MYIGDSIMKSSKTSVEILLCAMALELNTYLITSLL